MRFLDREAEIETRYGGGFVQSIDGSAARPRTAGASTGSSTSTASSRRSAPPRCGFAPGDRIWWDYRDWTDAMRVPAVVGSWPEPFARHHRARPRSRGARASCLEGGSACGRWRQGGGGASARRSTAGSGAGRQGRCPRLLVGRGPSVRAAAVGRARGRAGPERRLRRLRGAGRMAATTCSRSTSRAAAPEPRAAGRPRGRACGEGTSRPSGWSPGPTQRASGAPRAARRGLLRDRYAVAQPTAESRSRCRSSTRAGDEDARSPTGPGTRPALRPRAPAAAIVFLGSFAVVAFVFSNPIVLAAAGAGVLVAGLARGSRARRWRSRRATGWRSGSRSSSSTCSSAQRGETILVRGWDLPVLGQTGRHASSRSPRAACLRCGSSWSWRRSRCYSACVDPDRVLRLLRPVARRSALTATLIARAGAARRRRPRAAARGRALAGPGGGARRPRGDRRAASWPARSTAPSMSPRRSSCAAYARGAPAPARRAAADRRHDAGFLAMGLAVVAVGRSARPGRRRIRALSGD